MNNKTFTTGKEIKGNKTTTRVFCDGVEIGKRSSLREYRFALVVTRSQAAALAYAKSELEHSGKMAEEYAGVAENKPGCRAAYVRKHNSNYFNQFIADGSFAKWAEHSRQSLPKIQERINQLSSGPLPEYQKPYVTSWHQQRKSVPNVRESEIFVAVVEIQ